jgi:hypothetical protein
MSLNNNNCSNGFTFIGTWGYGINNSKTPQGLEKYQKVVFLIYHQNYQESLFLT